jgi:hypothetical protein
MGRTGKLFPAVRIGRALVDEADGDRTASDRSGYPGAEMQRRAALQRRIDRLAIDATQSGRRTAVCSASEPALSLAFSVASPSVETIVSCRSWPSGGRQ